jgi:predicted RNase H-like HicB family nuclease
MTRSRKRPKDPNLLAAEIVRLYTRIILPAEEGGFTGEILEFPGCFAEGDSPDEIFENLERAATSWIEAALEQDQDIPEPAENQRYGGKIALRLPRSIHRQAARMAERDSTSLNQFLLAAISARVGAADVCARMRSMALKKRKETKSQEQRKR